MIMKIKHLFLLLTAMIAATACSGHGDDTTNETTADNEVNAVEADTSSLGLPDIPVTITDRQERANYMMEHFWDKLDFTDTVRSHNRDFIEQTFSDYAALFSIADSASLQRSVARLVHRAEADTAALHIVLTMANKYLYEPNSPMQNEDYYGIFLPLLVDNTNVNQADRMRYRFEQECISKNRCGHIASDFSYIDRNGRRGTLLGTKCAPRMLLIFFDPDCEECKTAIAGLRKSERLNGLIEDGRVTVLAIYAEGDMNIWKKAKDEMPSNWIVARDVSSIEDNDTYILRAMPSVYLLDSDKRILIKDTTAERAMAEL
jgi:hypothetical protein